MLNYNDEADRYDATRGGEQRATAAADAVARLLPENAVTVLDVACGTGIVTGRLARPARHVIGLDRSSGMLARAAARLPGQVVLGDAAHLPFRTASVDAVLIIWLLHLLTDAGAVLAEAARVLRPGGVLITTVDKNEAAFSVPSDIAAATEAARQRYARPAATDRLDRILTHANGLGLTLRAETTFTGAGQGRSPQQWRQQILAGRIPWTTAQPDPTGQPDLIGQSGPRASPQPTLRDHILGALAALPDQDRPRPDPIYRLIALTRLGSLRAL